jgi:ABC-type nitrate/sulfonate/bicarbonate transport system substrate-binding protein
MHFNARPHKVRRSVAVAAVVALAALASGCSGDSGESTAPDDTNGDTTSSVDAELLAKYGVDIPSTEISVGMQPFGDNMVMSIGMAEGYFADAGLVVEEEYSFVPQDQQVALLLSGDYDITSDYGPNVIRNYDGADGAIKMFGVVDATSGIAILAGPGTDYLTIQDALESADDFESAVQEVMAQLVGRSFSTDDVGAHRGFTDTAFELGGITTDDLGAFYAVDDNQALLLANGGQVDFVKPEGAAQTAELIRNGWYPILSLTDLIDNLPAGDPRAVSGLGHVGLSSTVDYYEQNHDTILRVASVMFRVIDAVLEDIETGDYSRIESVVPVLEAAASIDTSAEDMAVVYGDIGPFWSFEDQYAMWVDESSPWYYKTVYGVQLDAAKEAGTIRDADTDADDLFSAGEVYRELLQYKEDYDALLGEATGLTGDGAALAEIAARQYDARNYLDAFRILDAAVNKA